MVKYGIRLHPEERGQLLTLVPTGRAAAVTLRHAPTVLKAAVDAGKRPGPKQRLLRPGPPVPPPSSASARRRGGPQGPQAAVSRQLPLGLQDRQRDKAQEAQLLAVDCRAPPADRAWWLLKLLANKLGALHSVDTIRPECRSNGVPPSGQRRVGLGVGRCAGGLPALGRP